MKSFSALLFFGLAGLALYSTAVEAACARGLTQAAPNSKEEKASTELIRHWKTSGSIPSSTRVSTIISGKNVREYVQTAKDRKFSEFTDSARIDNQGVVNEGGVQYNNIQLQLKNKSYAIVLLKVGVSKTAAQMRSAFNKSLKQCSKEILA